MARGEESLRLEIVRRRASSHEELARVPAPPQPTTTSSIPLMLGLVTSFALVGGLSCMALRTLMKKY